VTLVELVGLVGVTEIVARGGIAGLIVKELEVPLSVLAVLVAVIVKLPESEIVTPWEERIPPVKLAEVPLPADSVPVEVTSTVPIKFVTVFPRESRAIICILKAAPAVWVPMLPPPTDSTRKLSMPTVACAYLE
jgi:hypothetical protein